MGDSLLRDRIVGGVRDAGMRKKLLEKKNLTSKMCVDIVRASEATETRMKAMSISSDHVHKVGKSFTKGRPYRPDQKKMIPKRNTQKHTTAPTRGPKQKCKFCGYEHERDKLKCPAWGKKCNLCGEQNHFSSRCPKRKRVNHVNEEYSSTEEYIDSVTVNTVDNKEDNTDKEVYAEMLVNDTPVRFQVDSGASVNLITEQFAPAKLNPTKTVLVMWNKAEVRPMGTCRLTVRNPKNRKKYSVEFVVVREQLTPILGAKASQHMELVTVHSNNFHRVAAVKTGNDMINHDVFDGGLGQLPGNTKLQVNPDIPTHIAHPKRLPVALKPKLKEELDRLVNLGVLSPVSQPTDWVSNMVITQKKSGELRICIDPKPLNEALKREHFQLPVLDDILPEIAKAKVFSSADLQAGYWHVILEEESSLLTTFATPFGRYRWRRLPFGTCVSSEIFQKKLMQVIGDLDGVLCVADDIIVFGVGETNEQATQDHDKKFVKLLERCREVGIRLNRDKLKLRQPSIPFLGHMVTNQGLMPDPTKVKAVQEMPAPQDVEGVQRVNGFVNYLAKFLPKLSDVMEPLRKLTRKDVP